MPSNKRFFRVLISSFITACLLLVIQLMNLPTKIFLIIDNGASGGVYTLLIIYAVLGVVAGLPSTFYLWRQKVPYWLAVNIFACLEAFSLAYGMMYAIGPNMHLLWVIAYSLFAILTYMFGYLIFEKMNIRFRYKLLLCAGLIVATTVVADRLPLLFIGA